MGNRLGNCWMLPFFKEEKMKDPYENLRIAQGAATGKRVKRREKTSYEYRREQREIREARGSRVDTDAQIREAHKDFLRDMELKKAGKLPAYTVKGHK